MSPFVLPFVLLACAAPETLPATGRVFTESFAAVGIDDTYLLRIRLPPGVDAEDAGAYPLVVQLDPTFVGLAQFDTTVGLVSTHAADGDWPEAVVVGLDYADPYAGRERDYRLPDPLVPTFDGDGADRFFAVLRDELIPHLQATLPVDANRSTLVGHSNGAVFAWYAALRHEEDGPPLFSGYVAADGGIGQELFTLERWHSERATTWPVRLYASHALYNGASQAVAFNGLVERVEARGFADLSLRTEALDTDHGGAVAPSFENGLDFVLGGGE